MGQPLIGGPIGRDRAHLACRRPKGIERSAGKLAVWTGQQVQQVAVPWTMTATGVDHLYRGLLTIDCSVEAGVVMGMRDTPPDGE